ncbi:hypothetical protein BGY98DRAFT_678481 [Russula aff. rugulosa BPL654]|nr:hypothetical protein BGY98DRAFT_678481 [Russula aff. rugulosa BPL654]
MSSISTSLYGVHPHDDHGLHQNLMAQIDANPSMGSGEPFYPTLFDGVPAPFFPNPNNISATQSPHEELVVPTFLTNGVTNDAGLAPAFPTYNAVPHSIPFVTSSLFFSGLPTSPGSTLVPLVALHAEAYPSANASQMMIILNVLPCISPRVKRSPRLGSHTAQGLETCLISSRSKSNVLSTRFIPDAVSPRPVRPTLHGKSTCSRNNTV